MFSVYGFTSGAVFAVFEALGVPVFLLMVLMTAVGAHVFWGAILLRPHELVDVPEPVFFSLGRLLLVKGFCPQLGKAAHNWAKLPRSPWDSNESPPDSYAVLLVLLMMLLLLFLLCHQKLFSSSPTWRLQSPRESERSKLHEVVATIFVQS